MEPSSTLTSPAQLTSPAVRTPSPPQLTSPPPTAPLSNTNDLVEAAAAVLYSHHHVANASPEQLRAMVDHLTNALRDVRLSAAHYKLQHNMAVMESQEAASRMQVELAMAHRELDVLQQADEKRPHPAAPHHAHADTASAASAIIVADMSRQNQLLHAENDHLRDLFEQQKRLIEHREGELATLIDENDRLKSRIRKNRDHMAPFLEHINDQPSPRSTFATSRPLHRTPLSNDSIQGPNNFDALLLADKMLSQETVTAPPTPATPRTATHAPSSRLHHRGAQSMSSLPNSPNRRSHPYSRPPRTPPAYLPATIPKSAPPAHYHQKPVHDRRQSSNSTITASSVDDEEAFTDREDHDHTTDSPPAQRPRTMHPPSSNLVQSKLFGHVKKARSSARPKHDDKLRPAVGLGMGGLRE